MQNCTDAFCALSSSLLSYKFVNYTVCKFRPLIMKIFKTEFLLNAQLLNTCLFISNTRVLSESASLASHVRENLQQAHFQLFCQHLDLFFSNSLIESNKLNCIMKQHFGFLPTKFEVATLITAELSRFLYDLVVSFSVGRTSIHTRDLNDFNQLLLFA